MQIYAGDDIYIDVDTADLSGEPTDPSALRIFLRKPDGTDVSFVYGVDGSLVRMSLGKFRLSYFVPSAGPYRVAVIATGAVTKREATDFLALGTVADEAFPPAP